MEAAMNTNQRVYRAKLLLKHLRSLTQTLSLVCVGESHALDSQIG